MLRSKLQFLLVPALLLTLVVGSARWLAWQAWSQESPSPVSTPAALPKPTPTAQPAKGDGPKINEGKAVEVARKAAVQALKDDAMKRFADDQFDPKWTRRLKNFNLKGDPGIKPAESGWVISWINRQDNIAGHGYEVEIFVHHQGQTKVLKAINYFSPR